MIQTELGTSVHQLVRQSVLFIRELKNIASHLVTRINTEALTAKDLIVCQNSLSQVRENFTNWPHGSLTSLNVRNEMVRQWPGVYVNAAALLSDFQAVNQAFNSLMAEVEALLVLVRAAGQLVDVNPVSGLETSPILTSPETDALRTEAVLVRDSIA